MHVFACLHIIGDPQTSHPPSPFNLGTSKAFHSSGCSTQHVLLCILLRQWLCLIHLLESSPERAEREMQSFEKGMCKHYLQGFPLENGAVICQVGPGSPISTGEKTRTPFRWLPSILLWRQIVTCPYCKTENEIMQYLSFCVFFYLAYCPSGASMCHKW